MAQKTMVKVTQREREIARELAEFKYNLTIKYEREEAAQEANARAEKANAEVEKLQAEVAELKAKLAEK